MRATESVIRAHSYAIGLEGYKMYEQSRWLQMLREAAERADKAATVVSAADIPQGFEFTQGRILVIEPVKETIERMEI